MTILSDMGSFLGGEMARLNNVWDVADIATRDAIPAEKRYKDLWVQVADTGAGSPGLYSLGAGLTNADWVNVITAATV